MLRPLLILPLVLGPMWLVYTFGLWALVASGVLAVMTLLFSSGPAHPSTVSPESYLTGHHTTMFAGF